MNGERQRGTVSEARDLLRGVEIFTGLHARQINRLARVATFREFPAGTTILRRGETGVALYVIVRGRVAVAFPSEESGQEHRLGELGPGSVFGEISLIDGGPRSASIIAVETTECLVLTRWDFGGDLGRDPDLARALLPMLCGRIRSLQARLLKYEPEPTTD